MSDNSPTTEFCEKPYGWGRCKGMKLYHPRNVAVALSLFLLPHGIFTFWIGGLILALDPVEMSEEDRRKLIEVYGVPEELLLTVSPYEVFIKFYGEPEKLLGEEEPKWEYAVVYPMRIDYAELAKWDLSMAVREFIQNALDGSEEVVGESKLEWKITDGDRLVIKNPSKPLNFKHMIMGGSDKPCWSRGRYGEGMKVGASYICAGGGTVYIISHDLAFRFIKVKDYFGALIGKPVRPLPGYTEAILVYTGIFEIEDEMKRIYFRDAMERVISSVPMSGKKYGCDYTRDAKIGLPGNMIYTKDIFVNYSDVLTGYKSIYSYDLPWIELSRDRKHVTNVYDLKRQIGILLSILPDEVVVKVADEILNKVLRRAVCLEVYAPYLVLKGDLLEVKIVSEESEPYNIRDKITDLIYEMGSKLDYKPEDVGYTTSKALISSCLYHGILPVLDEIGGFYRIHSLKRAEDILMERQETAREEAEKKRGTSVFNYTELPKLIGNIPSSYAEYVMGCSAFTRLMLKAFNVEDKVKISFAYFDKLEGVSEHTLAVADTKKNEIIYPLDTGRWEKIVDEYGDLPQLAVAFEEVAHIIGEKVYRIPSHDLSAMFEKVQNRVFKKMTTYIPDHLLEFSKSVSGLCYDVKPDFPYEEVYSLSRRDIIVNFVNYYREVTADAWGQFYRTLISNLFAYDPSLRKHIIFFIKYKYEVKDICAIGWETLTYDKLDNIYKLMSFSKTPDMYLKGVRELIKEVMAELVKERLNKLYVYKFGEWINFKDDGVEVIVFFPKPDGAYHVFDFSKEELLGEEGG